MTTSRSKEISLSDLAERLGCVLEGDGRTILRGAGTLNEAREDQISFLANARYERFMEQTQAAAVIVATNYQGAGKNLLRCDDPYFAFRQAMVLLYGFRVHPFTGVDPSARVDRTARLGENVRIAAFAYVGPNAQIGDNAVLYPGVFVGPDCRIGAGCLLYPNAVLYDGSVLGDRVTIHACTVIGEDGFGYSTHAGQHEKIPQAGHVEIGDDVEIGANCSIDRATLGATKIGPGTKFSNLIAIGHGTKVGSHCLFVAQAGIAGSTTIGDYCVFAGQSGASGHIQIGDRVRVGAKSGVHNDIGPDQEVLGSPALPLAKARRVYMTMNQLPELRKEMKQMAQQIQALQKQVQALGGKAP